MSLDSQNQKAKTAKMQDLRDQEQEELAEILSKRYNLPYSDLSKVSINTDALRFIPEAEARQAQMASFKIFGKKLSVAILTPNNNKAKEIIKDLENKGWNLQIYLVSENSLKKAWSYYQELSKSKKSEAGLIKISNERIERYLKEIKTVNQIKEEIKKIEKQKEDNISSILEIILAGALSTGASDIHLEPQENNLRLRYRLDGVLQDIYKINSKYYWPIAARIKLISGMKINIKLTAQDGRFSIKAGEDEIEIRSSIVPSAYGESVVMRVLNPKSIQVTFETLGVEDHLFKVFEREIKKPNGLILLTGPTGSGKTTTLYSFLRQVNSPENKIITIEDPIEYHLEGINQTQVNRKKGYDFLSGLRAALRQDPDIIMVGEIRDSETAKIAINSALTGHLVFSTLHTNNCFGAIPRLIDLEVNPKVMTSSLTLSIAQRLVRRLCVNCRQKESPKEWEKDLINKVKESVARKRKDIVLEDKMEVYRPVGCDKCNNTGYKGRQGIFEAVVMDEAVAKKTIENPSEKELKKVAEPQGILDMREDGVIKVLNGLTSMEDLARVVDLLKDF
ncbi:MAG TPA: type II/IV secretion system protein [Candidatus Vogelbacteria bacterium]|nr:type II/IV secretion system protein [Candidatus Vogelbacteria bacterium]